MRSTALAFGTFEFDPNTGELRKRGLQLKLQAKPAAVLSLLLRHPSELVTHEQLKDEVWGPDTFVDLEHGLGSAVWKLRQRLGDVASNPRFIENVPGKGYRFIAPVQTGKVTQSTSRRVIAICPFKDLDGPETQDYFVTGLTEELMTHLGRVNPNQLSVIALRRPRACAFPPSRR